MTDHFEAAQEAMDHLSRALNATLIPHPAIDGFQEHLKNGDFSDVGLAEVAATLRDNIRRLELFTFLPMSLFWYGREFHAVRGNLLNACQNAGVDPNSSDRVVLMHDGMMRWIFGIDKYQQHPIATTFDGVYLSGFAADHGEDDEERKRQIESFYAAIITQSWTIFEATSEDLWEAALNFSPHLFQDAFKETTVSIGDLANHDFNVGAKIGTILKDRPGFGFRKFKSIRDTYRSAFKDQFTPIEDVFKNHELRYSSAMRNLLIHKRGVIDMDFNTQTAGIPDLPVFNPKDPPIRLDPTGAMSARVFAGCRSSACWLVNAVHGWIKGHQKPPATT